MIETLDTAPLLNNLNVQKAGTATSLILAGQKLTGSAPQGNKRDRQSARDFETMVISQMLQPMFEGQKADSLFGGGVGEDAFKSVFVDSVAQQVTQHGGLGISAQVQAELIKLQSTNPLGNI